MGSTYSVLRLRSQEMPPGYESCVAMLVLQERAVYIRYLVKFNADAVRTASVARVGVGKGAGAPRNSERRPLTNIAHNVPKR